jgi:HD-GYP domain-containing protein (c-di-GMP phosphodiesterase class II)
VEAWFDASMRQEAAAGAGLFLLMAAWLCWSHHQRKKEKRRLRHTLLMLERMQPSAGLENNLAAILELVGSIVAAPGYAFYILDAANRQFTLKAVRNADRPPGNMEPSYSGLLPYNKEVYLPVLSLPQQAAPSQLTLGKEGELPLLSLPVGQYGLIRIAPLSRLPRKAKAQLQFIAEVLPKLLDVMIEAEQMKMKAEVVVTSGEALHAIGAMALDPVAALGKMIGMLAAALDMSALLAFIDSGNGSMTPIIRKGWSADAERRIADVSSWVLPLMQQASQAAEAVVRLRPHEPFYDSIPKEFKNNPDDTFTFSRFRLAGKDGILVCRTDRLSPGDWDEEEQLAALHAAMRQASRLADAQAQLKLLAGSYTELLKLLARTIDSMNPYTVGYSELMALYSAAVAREMNLSRKEAAAISLAAYLSNIGVLGLSEELYLKEGKFSEIESEKMKLHAEVGAAIVEITIGDKAVADIIRYHHERMDGNGYPAGLHGEEIPVGARIIAVVQTFLAKIGGRRYRDPLPFDKALGQLKAAEGSQLDAKVVQAFLNWWERKRSSREALPNRPLGPCWEMCCTPSYICRTCPAYGQDDKPCWEMERNNCKSHGKSCETCFVYTEALGRSSRNRIVQSSANGIGE